MDKVSFFNIKRFILLLRNDLLRNYRTLFIGAGTVAAIYFIITLTPMIFSHTNVDYDFNAGFFPAVLYICGFLLSAASFQDIHHPQKNTAFFMLPATVFEKFASRLLLTTIGYMAAGIVFYLVLNLISALLATLFTTGRFPILNPFSREILEVLKIYFITQSIFLFGGIYFKKHPFMKTGLSLFGLFTAFSIFAALVFRIVYHDFFSHIHFMNGFRAGDFMYLSDFGDTFVTILKYLLLIVVAPYFWIVAYIRLGEKEV